MGWGLGCVTGVNVGWLRACGIDGGGWVVGNRVWLGFLELLYLIPTPPPPPPPCDDHPTCDVAWPVSCGDCI